MAKMRAVQVARVNGPRGEVRVRIEACGVCYSDSLTVEGQWPGLSVRSGKLSRLNTT